MNPFEFARSCRHPAQLSGKMCKPFGLVVKAAGKEGIRLAINLSGANERLCNCALRGDVVSFRRSAVEVGLKIWKRLAVARGALFR